VQLLVPVESRYEVDASGACWTVGAPGYEFWTRYLSIFDSVSVAARVKRVPSAAPEATRVDGPGVSVLPLPYFVGPLGYLERRRAYTRSMRSAIARSEAVLLRVPGMAGTVASRFLQGRPYAVEVVGDPYEVFSSGASRHPARAFFRWLFTRSLRKVVAEADVVCYVSSHALPQRYPPRSARLVTYYSSIELGASAFADSPRHRHDGALRLVTVGSLEQPYKGVDTVLSALRTCRDRGTEAHLTVVGDGRLRGSLEALAGRLGIADMVTFTGQLSAAGVRRHLDEAHAFVLASRTEGLPRAMIEAMARGLPCIGTNVGGIPELLSADEMVAPGDSEGLARLIDILASQSDAYSEASSRNLLTATQYRDDVLKARRDAAYDVLRSITESAIDSGRPASGQRRRSESSLSNTDFKS
jgi:glycosyltransferase involved in cell wall biosynthesis